MEHFLLLQIMENSLNFKLHNEGKDHMTGSQWSLSWIFILTITIFQTPACNESTVGDAEQKRPSEETGGVPGFALGCRPMDQLSDETQKTVYCEVYQDNLPVTDDLQDRQWQGQWTDDVQVTAEEDIIHGRATGVYRFVGSPEALNSIDADQTVGFAGNHPTTGPTEIKSSLKEAKNYQEQVNAGIPLP